MFKLNFSMSPGSLVVERPAVNREVVGSNPTPGALNYFVTLYKIFELVFLIITAVGLKLINELSNIF